MRNDGTDAPRSLRRLTIPAATVLLFFLLAPAGHAAGGFNLFASYWDTEALDETFGGGIAFAFPLGSSFALDLRAAYYEKLESDDFDDFIDDLFDDEESVFVDNGIELIPIEVGIRYNFRPLEPVNVYIGGGVGYYLLSADVGEVDDELGGYALLGAQLGDPDGISFLVEAQYRRIEGTIRNPDDLEDIEIDDRVAFDLDGVVINAGISWRW